MIPVCCLSSLKMVLSILNGHGIRPCSLSESDDPRYLHFSFFTFHFSDMPSTKQPSSRQVFSYSPRLMGRPIFAMRKGPEDAEDGKALALETCDLLVAWVFWKHQSDHKVQTHPMLFLSRRIKPTLDQRGARVPSVGYRRTAFMHARDDLFRLIL